MVTFSEARDVHVGRGEIARPARTRLAVHIHLYIAAVDAGIPHGIARRIGEQPRDAAVLVDVLDGLGQKRRDRDDLDLAGLAIEGHGNRIGDDDFLDAGVFDAVESGTAQDAVRGVQTS